MAQRWQLRETLANRVVGEHVRAFGRGVTVYNPWHYVPVLAGKPGALRSAPWRPPSPVVLEVAGGGAIGSSPTGDGGQRLALEAMGELKRVAPEVRVPRNGMRGAYDEIVATAVKRRHEPQRVIGDLLGAEINEVRADRHRSEGRLNGPVDQVPDDDREAAAGQGMRRVSEPASGRFARRMTILTSTRPPRTRR